MGSRRWTSRGAIVLVFGVCSAPLGCAAHLEAGRHPDEVLCMIQMEHDVSQQQEPTPPAAAIAPDLIQQLVVGLEEALESIAPSEMESRGAELAGPGAGARRGGPAAPAAPAAAASLLQRGRPSAGPPAAKLFGGLGMAVDVFRVVHEVVPHLVADVGMEGLRHPVVLAQKYGEAPGRVVDLLDDAHAWSGTLLPKLNSQWPGLQDIWSAVLTVRSKALHDGDMARPWNGLSVYFTFFALGVFWEFYTRFRGAKAPPPQEGEVENRGAPAQEPVTASGTTPPPAAPVAAAAAAAVAAAPSPRVQAWDVARFLLVTCVIVDHLYSMLYPPGDDGSMLSSHKTGDVYWFETFMLTGLVLVSGVFGGPGRPSWDAVGRTCCYTAGAIVFTATLTIIVYHFIFGSAVVMHLGGTFWTWEVLCGDKWYLWSLLAWRITITPAFRFCRKVRHSVMLLLAIFCVSYFLRHATGRIFVAGGCELEVLPPAAFGLDLQAAENAMKWPAHCSSLLPAGRHLDKAATYLFTKGALRVIWMNFWYFSQFYALGQVLTPDAWSKLLRRPFVVTASFYLLLVWFLVHATSAAARRHNSSACFLSDQCVYFMQYPAAVVYGKIRFLGWLFDAWDFLHRSALAVAFLSLITALTNYLEQVAPSLVAVVAEMGSRSLYAYLLHWELLQVLVLTGLWQLTGMVHNRTSRIILAWPIAVHIYLTLSSRFSERVFYHLMYPYWLKSIFSSAKERLACAAK